MAKLLSCCMTAVLLVIVVAVAIAFAPFVAALALIGFSGLVLANMFVSK